MPLPLFVSRSCPALLSVPLAGSDRVTLRYSVLAFARPYNSPQLHQRFGLVLEAIQLREFGIYAAPFICLALLPRPPLNSTNSTDSEQLYLYRI